MLWHSVKGGSVSAFLHLLVHPTRSWCCSCWPAPRQGGGGTRSAVADGRGHGAGHGASRGASRGGDGHRATRNGAHFSRQEVMNMLDLVQQFLPVGRKEWEEVAATHAESYPRSWARCNFLAMQVALDCNS